MSLHDPHNHDTWLQKNLNIDVNKQCEPILITTATPNDSKVITNEDLIKNEVRQSYLKP